MFDFVGTGLVQGWNESFWKAIGLADLVSEGFSRIGTDILPPGTSVGHGLKEGVADEFGLLPKTPVGTAIVDAHAGGLGMSISGRLICGCVESCMLK